MSIFKDPIIVTLSCNDPLVSLQTYDPKHGWSQRFYLTKQALCSQLDNAESSVTECDLLNVCNVASINNGIRFRVYWLQGYDELHGYQQTFIVPFEAIRALLDGHHVRYLSYSSTYRTKANIYLTPTAQIAIAKADKLKRHALRKFFRDNFDYGKDEKLVIQRDEFVNGFYFFSTVSRYEGGIVPHETEVKGKDGKLHRKLYYGLHT